MAARLKTFVTSDGLMEYVVATTSKPKALDAWGVRQDLFKAGDARQTDEPALVKAAEARPGEVFTRPKGGKALKPPRLPKRPSKPEGPTRAQLKRIADLQRRLQALDASFEEARAAIGLQRQALDARQARLSLRHDKDRQALEARLSEARQGIGSG